MRAEEPRIESDARDPFGRPGVHTGVSSCTGHSATAVNRNSPGFLPRGSQVVIDGLTGLVRQLELDRPSCLPLPDRCAVDRVTVGCDVIDLEGHDIAATQLAVDREIEHG